MRVKKPCVMSRFENNKDHVLLVCLFWLLATTTCVNATITIMETGRKFASRPVTTLGKRMMHSAEYLVHLQYLHENFSLCPQQDDDDDDDLRQRTTSHYNVTVPADNWPVALLTRSDGCSLADKAAFVQKHVQPPGVVQFLIVDNSNGRATALTSEEQHVVDSSRSLPFEFSGGGSWLGRGRRRPSDDVPFYLLQVTYRDLANLYNIVYQAEESGSKAGPRATVDSRLGSFLSGAGALWVAVAALLAACACSFLLMVTGSSAWLPEEPEQQAQRPARQPPRRLTREQVKRLLTVYRYDGQEGLFCSRGRLEMERSDGLDRGDTPLLPQPLQLHDCSICLDEYERNDRIRCLPCGHAFHAKCIGKWLVERSATCPLCKDDSLWEEEEEDEGDEEEEQSPPTHEDVLRGPPPPTQESRPSLWTRLQARLTERMREMEDAEDARRREIADLLAPEVVQPPPQEELRNDPFVHRTSWWRRWFPTPNSNLERSSTAEGVQMSTSNTLTEPLLRSNDDDALQHPGSSNAAAPIRPVAAAAAAETAEAQQENPLPEPPTEENLGHRQVSV